MRADAKTAVFCIFSYKKRSRHIKTAPPTVMAQKSDNSADLLRPLDDTFSMIKSVNSCVVPDTMGKSFKLMSAASRIVRNNASIKSSV